MKCNFSKRQNISTLRVEGGDYVIPQVTHFKYIGCIVKNVWDIEADLNRRIKVGWLKWTRTSCVLCDTKYHSSWRNFFIKHGKTEDVDETKFWMSKNQHENKISMTEIMMLCWMCGKTKWDMIRNDNIERIEVASIVEKMMKNRLKRFEYVHKRPIVYVEDL